MPKIIAYFILYLSNLSALPAIWVGRKDRISLWYYAVACFAADTISFVLKRNHIGHAWVSNLFLLAEFITIITYFKTVFLHKRYNNILVPLVCIIAIAFCYRAHISMIAAKTDKEAFNYMDAALFYVCYIIFSLAGLYKVMSEVQTIRIERSPLFLSCVAFLLYASGALFPFLYKNIAIVEDMDKFSKLWMYFFLPLNTIKNILLAFSLYITSVRGRGQLY